MPDTVTFENLDTATVDEYADLLAALMAEAAPALNFSKGSVLYELIITKAAAAYVYQGTPLDNLRDQWNWAAVVADPASADEDIVDKLLSNFNAERSDGTKAVGYVDVILTEQHAMVMSVGTVFTSGTLTFETLIEQTAIAAEADRTSDSDKVLFLRPDGNYSFRVAVQASVEGVDGNLITGTSFTVSPLPMFFSEALASADFVGGTDSETNTDAVARAASGVTASVLSGADNGGEAIKDAVPSSTDVAVIGMQDAEMIRDQRSLLGVSNGGRVDVYLRTQAPLDTASASFTATLVDATTNEYQIVMDRDDAPGVVDIVSVLPQGSTDGGTLEILTKTWGYDVSGLTRAPDLLSAIEAAFSRYQTVTISFVDPAATGGTYDVSVRRMPNIALAQAYCLDDANVDAMADWLVRSPIPVVVSVEMTVKAPAGSDVDEDAVAAAVAAAINAHPFSDELNSSILIDAAQSALPTGGFVAMPIGMFGLLIKPDRTTVGSASGNVLQFDADYTQSVSEKTIAFFSRADDVSVAAEVI